VNYDLPPPPPSVAVTNIADLSYRNYDGPLISRAARWWTISKSGIQSVMKKPGFWVAVAFCLVPYLIHAFAFYLQEQVTAMGAPGRLLQGAPEERFGLLFYTCLCGNTNEISMFVIALLMGTGSIAADNRANALMVYLSKPLTKGDYLFGKWAGIFLTLWMVALLPCLLLFLFCMVLYTGDGFLKENPHLILHILTASLIPAFLHTSLLIGLSAWSKSPRLVGATYAAIYFVGAILTWLLGMSLYPNQPEINNLVQHLSLNGIMEGIIQNLLHITLAGNPFSRGGPAEATLGMPMLMPLVVTGIVLVVGGVAAARMKINAVEVIRG
jgi:ABC-2 type transport system permease protein